MVRSQAAKLPPQRPWEYAILYVKGKGVRRRGAIPVGVVAYLPAGYSYLAVTKRWDEAGVANAGANQYAVWYKQKQSLLKLSTGGQWSSAWLDGKLDELNRFFRGENRLVEVGPFSEVALRELCNRVVERGEHE